MLQKRIVTQKEGWSLEHTGAAWSGPPACNGGIFAAGRGGVDTAVAGRRPAPHRLPDGIQSAIMFFPCVPLVCAGPTSTAQAHRSSAGVY